MAGSLVVSGLNGLLFTALDWLDVDSEVDLRLSVVAMGVELLIAVGVIVGLALLKRAPAAPGAAS